MTGSRPSSASRGYGYRWQQYRARYLDQHPLCRMCKDAGHITIAEVVDHIRPHKGDQRLFWDPVNHQALCKPCHDRHKQRLDRGGEAPRVIGMDGWPA